MRLGFYLLLPSGSRSGVVLRSRPSLSIALVSRTTAISLIARVSLIALTAIPLLATRLVTRIALIPARITLLIPLTALLRRGHRRTRPLNFLRRTLEAAKLLTKRLNLALVGCLLALGFLEELEKFVELIERLAQGGDDLHHFVHGFANGRRLRWLERPERQLWRTLLTFLAHRRRWPLLLARLRNWFGGLLLRIGRR